MNDSPEMDSNEPVPLPKGVVKPTRTRQLALRRHRIILFLLLPVLFAGVLFWVAERALSPEQLYLRTQSLLEERIATGFSLEKVQWQWPGSILLEDLVIYAPQGSRFPELLKIGQLDLDLSLLSLFAGQFKIERVELDGSTIVLERNDFGDLTLLSVVRSSTAPLQGPVTLEDSLKQAERTVIQPPEFVIRNLDVQTCPDTVAHSPGGLDISQLRLEVSAEDPELWEMDGVAFDPSVKSIRLDGGGRLSLGDFELVLEVAELSLDEELRQRIPPALRQIWDRYNPSGIASLRHELFFRDAREIRNSMTVNISEGELRLTEPAVTLESLSGELTITPEAISFRNPLTGKVFGADARLEGAIDLETLQPGSSDLRASLEGLAFEPRIYEILPDQGKKIWDTYNPSGAFDFSIEAVGEEFPPQISEISVMLRKADGNYAPYPYPLRDIDGEIRYTPNLLEIDLEGGLPETPVRARGSFETVAFGERHLLIEGFGIPIDDRVRTALGDRFSGIYDDYSPTGISDLAITLERQKLGDPLDLKVIVKPTRASLSHKFFPYRIDEVQGEIIFDISGKKLLLRDLIGQHGISPINLSAGYVDLVTGDMELPIESQRLVPDEDLLAALPDDVEARLRSLDILNGGGALETVVELYRKDQPKIAVYVRSRVIEPLQLKYSALPYPLIFHGGQVVYSSTEERVRLDDLYTDPTASPIIRVSGEIGPDDSAIPLGFNSTLMAIGLSIEEGPDSRGLALDEQKLVSSLPPDPKSFVEKMNLSGQVTGSLNVVHRYGTNSNGEGTQIVEYDARGKLKNGGLDFGLNAEELFADFELHGGIEPGSGHTFSGQLQNLSLNFNKFLATVPEDRTLDFTYGVTHPRLTPQGAESYELPTSWVLDRIPSDRSRLFQAEIGPASIYGGTLDGFFFVDLGDLDGSYAGEILVDSLQLAEGSANLFGRPDIAGSTSIDTRFAGIVGVKGSTIGDGSFRISNGNLARIPLIAGALINPFEGLNRRNNKIKSAEGAFTIANSAFEFKGMGSLKLDSPTGAIFGKGKFLFDTSIDLIFEPQTLGGTPLISDIANRLLRFRVVGTIEDPEITVRKVKQQEL